MARGASAHRAVVICQSDPPYLPDQPRR